MGKSRNFPAVKLYLAVFNSGLCKEMGIYFF